MEQTGKSGCTTARGSEGNDRWRIFNSVNELSEWMSYRYKTGVVTLQFLVKEGHAHERTDQQDSQFDVPQIRENPASPDAASHTMSNPH